MFITAGKTNYSLMSIQYLWMLQALNEDVLDLYNEYRVASFSGEPGTGVGFDHVIE